MFGFLWFQKCSQSIGSFENYKYYFRDFGESNLKIMIFDLWSYSYKIKVSVVKNLIAQKNLLYYTGKSFETWKNNFGALFYQKETIFSISFKTTSPQSF